MHLAALLALVLAVLTPALAETVRIPGPEGVALNAELYLPPGPPTGAAVVALHGCGGPFPVRDRQWAALLTAGGHAVLFPDSFSTRGLGSQCRVAGAERVATAVGLRRADALAAARWLAAQPYAPPGGVVVLGWSDGGSTTLAVALKPEDKPPSLIRGFVAFYPGCRWSVTDPSGPPVLLMIGESDDWTPAAPCRALAGRLGGRIDFVAYPGAYHDFDTTGPVRVMRNIPSARTPDHSVHQGGNPDARADALRRVPAFIAGLAAAP
jgi:dienelactone hydrolase